MGLVCFPSSNIAEPKIELLTSYLLKMKGKISVENLCSYGAFIHTQMCSLCVGRSERGWTPVPGAGNWFPNV